MLTRRNFLGACTALGALGSLGVGWGVWSRRRLSMGQLGRIELTPLRGDRIRLRSESGTTLHATLSDVTERNYPAGPVAPATEQVSVLFDVRHTEPVEGGLFKIDHSEVCLGELHLFPVGSGGRVQQLEGIITRIL